MSFKELVENKTVAVVGNALSLQYKKHGEYIDSHDIVVRINIPGNLYYDNKMKEIYGEKMDAWCFWKASAFLSAHETKYMQQFTQAETKLEVVESSVAGVESIYTDETLKILEDKIAELYPYRFGRDYYKFSTGFLLLNYLSNCNPKTVSVFGFDFKHTPTFYDSNLKNNMVGGIDIRFGHDYRIEQKYIIDHLLKQSNNRYKIIR